MTATVGDAVSPAAAPRRPRGRYVVALVVCLGAIAWLIWSGISSSLVYLRDVSDAVAQREELGTKEFRIAGQVVPGSIDDSGDDVRFVISDGLAEATIVVGDQPPETFRDCAPVVVEGRWAGEQFAGDRVLVKHGVRYDEDDYQVPAIDENEVGCPDPEKL